MKFNIEKSKMYNVFTSEDEKLTALIAPKFKTELLVLTEFNKNIICDLKNIKYIDSSGLSCFLIGERICKEKDISFILCNLNERAMKLVKLSKLDSVFTILPSLQEAKDYILLEQLEKNL